jgi:hypothetical protein
MSDVDAILFAFGCALTISNLYLNICFQAKVNARANSFLIISCVSFHHPRRVSDEI